MQNQISDREAVCSYLSLFAFLSLAFGAISFWQNFFVWILELIQQLLRCLKNNASFFEQRHEENCFLHLYAKTKAQISGTYTADQHLCFSHIESTILYFPKLKFQASNHLLWPYSPVCVGPDWDS